MRKLWILLAVVASAVGIMMIGGASTASACDPPNCPPGQKDDDNGHQGKDKKCPPRSPNAGGKPPCGKKPDCKTKPKCPGENPDPCKPKCPEPEPEPPAGACENADLVLLGDQAKIVCLYFPPITQEEIDEECPEDTNPLLAVAGPAPLNGGICVYLPPAEE